MESVLGLRERVLGALIVEIDMGNATCYFDIFQTKLVKISQKVSPNILIFSMGHYAIQATNCTNILLENVFPP